MSISWFITPYDPKHWEDPNDTSEKPTSDLWVDPTIYCHALTSRFNKIRFYSDYSYTVANPDGSTLEIWLHDDHQVISLDNSSVPFIADFALFHRSFVPLNFQLFFFNSASWDSLELKADTTKEDIKTFMGYTD